MSLVVLVTIAFERALTAPSGVIFYSTKEALIIARERIRHYNHVRSHSTLDYRQPSPQTQAPQLLQIQPVLLK